MNILDVLKQLRDDIKTWVTTNLNALNAKIDEKTIPIDSELNSESTNPVQNKAISKEINSINERVGNTPVATQISNAIDKVPTFSGDYNDLTNVPILEDGSGNMVIADESGNIIFKADAEGIHTTAVSLNGEAAASEKYVDEAIANIDIPEVDFTGYATEDFVASAVESAKEELSESITAEAEDWKVVDESGNIIFSVDASGAHTTNLTLSDGKAATETYVDNAIAAIDFPETDLTGYATEKYVDEAIAAIPETDLSDYYTKEQTNTAINTAKEELSESIVAESDEWKVVDEAGNVIFSVDASGAHTTELTLNGESVATESYVDDAIYNHNTDKAAHPDIRQAIKNVSDLVGTTAVSEQIDTAIADFIEQDPKALEALKELSQALEDHEDAYDALLEAVGSKATKAELKDMKEELSESIFSESDSWVVADKSGNKAIEVRGDGQIYVAKLNIDGVDVNMGNYLGKTGGTMAGAITMNGHNISGAGTITAAVFQASSDARLKTNITPYEYTKSILDLPVYKFDFIDGPKEQIGCLAQDLQEIYPELVQEKEDGYLSINENKLVYLLLEEVKRLNKKLEEV